MVTNMVDFKIYICLRLQKLDHSARARTHIHTHVFPSLPLERREQDSAIRRGDMSRIYVGNLDPRVGKEELAVSPNFGTYSIRERVCTLNEHPGSCSKVLLGALVHPLHPPLSSAEQEESFPFFFSLSLGKGGDSIVSNMFLFFVSCLLFVYSVSACFKEKICAFPPSATLFYLFNCPYVCN